MPKGTTTRRRPGVQAVTVAVGIAAYLAVMVLADQLHEGSAVGQVGDRIAIAVGAGLVGVLAWRLWPPPAPVPPGRLGRLLVLGGLALLALYGPAVAAVAGGWVDLPLAVFDIPAQLAVAALVIGALCGSIARTRARGVPIRVALRRALLVVLLVVVGLFGLQAGLTADFTAVEEVPWLLFFSVLLAVPALGHLRRPEAAPGATLFVAAVLAVHAAGPALAGYLREDVLAQVLVAVAVVLVALNPATSSMRPPSPRPSVLLLGMVAAVPIGAVTLRNAAATLQVGAGREEVMTIFGLALLAGIVILCLRIPGWTLPAGAVALAVGAFGVASVLGPVAPGSWGRGWGVAAIAWSIGAAGVQLSERRQAAPSASSIAQDARIERTATEAAPASSCVSDSRSAPAPPARETQRGSR